MRRAAKTDSNQSDIVAALRRAGCCVLSLAQLGEGCPDLLVGVNGRLLLLEVKSEDGVLNDQQREFFARWGKCARVVRTPEQAVLVALAGELRGNEP